MVAMLSEHDRRHRRVECLEHGRSFVGTRWTNELLAERSSVRRGGERRAIQPAEHDASAGDGAHPHADLRAGEADTGCRRSLVEAQLRSRAFLDAKVANMHDQTVVAALDHSESPDAQPERERPGQRDLVAVGRVRHRGDREPLGDLLAKCNGVSGIIGRRHGHIIAAPPSIHAPQPVVER